MCIFSRQGKTTYKILLSLENKKDYASNIYSKYLINEVMCLSVVKNVEVLKTMELIRSERKGRINILSLTPKGRQVLKHLKKIHGFFEK